MFLKIHYIKKNKNSFSIYFERPKNLNYYPAQFLILKKSGVEREFTIASSPTEQNLMITTKYGISRFKKNLESLKPGDQMESDLPSGTYTLDTRSAAVMLAGGIGITPMRSMIKYALDQKLDLPITLIYSNSDEDFVFKDELNAWQKQYPKLTIHYVVTSKDGQLDGGKLKNFLVPSSSDLDSIYYLAGPPAMVDDFEKILLKLGIEITDIRTDRFTGY